MRSGISSIGLSCAPNACPVGMLLRSLMLLMMLDQGRIGLCGFGLFSHSSLPATVEVTSRSGLGFAGPGIYVSICFIGLG